MAFHSLQGLNFWLVIFIVKCFTLFQELGCMHFLFLARLPLSVPTSHKFVTEMLTCLSQKQFLYSSVDQGQCESKCNLIFILGYNSTHYSITLCSSGLFCKTHPEQEATAGVTPEPDRGAFYYLCPSCSSLLLLFSWSQIILSLISCSKCSSVATLLTVCRSDWSSNTRAGVKHLLWEPDSFNTLLTSVS